jgi:hypothetical protein
MIELFLSEGQCFADLMGGVCVAPDRRKPCARDSVCNSSLNFIM